MKLINTALLSWENVLTIGAVLFFWACAAYAIHAQFMPPSNAS